MKSINSVGLAVISGSLLIYHFCTFVSCQETEETCGESCNWNYETSKCICPEEPQNPSLIRNERAESDAACVHYPIFCESIGDPHIRTFHGNYYHFYKEGVFTLAKLKIRSLWIQVQQVPCYGTACNCGVMAREGNVIIGITRCNNTSTIPVKYRLSKDAEIGSIHKIFGGWKISLLSGIEIEVIMWKNGKYMHVYIKGLHSEFKRYTGLCSVEAAKVPCYSVCKDSNCEQYRVNDSDSFFGIPQGNRPKCGNNTINPKCGCHVNYTNCSLPEDTKIQINTTIKCLKDNETQNETQNDGNRPNSFFVDKDHIPGDSINDPIEPEVVDRGLNIGYRIFGHVRALNPSPVQNLEDGRSRCNDALRLSPTYELCSSRVDTSMMVESCALDENMMKEDGPAKSIATEFETVCLDNIRLSIEADASSQELKDLLAKVEKLVCPSQCNQKGRCVDSKCQCNAGFMGTDCSLRIGQPPVVDRITMPVCDIRKHPCEQIELEATGLTNPEDVVCKMRSVDDLGGAVPPIQTSTPGISEGRVLCNLPLMPVSTKASINGISTTVFRVQVSISNDGQHYSQELPYTVLDGYCMECRASQNTLCQLKENTCSIGGRCYKAEETCSPDATKICNPAKCTTKWTGDSSTNCDDGSENCT